MLEYDTLKMRKPYLNISWASSICSLVRERWLLLCPCWAATGAAIDCTTG
jgi:hypothetical protein